MEEAVPKALPLIIVHSMEPTHCHIQQVRATTVTAGPRLRDILLSDKFTKLPPTEAVRLLNICFTKGNTLQRISNLFPSKEL